MNPHRPSIPRRHDLDALRAIAMLLGIALHGALAYMPLPAGGWPVQDTHQNATFGLFMSVVHGFRMPLFFLISGFFTAMMWRKRGLKSLLANRFQRIFLPLVIGMFTFVPAVWIVSIAAGISTATPATEKEADIWMAARQGDTEEMAAQLAAGAPLDEPDSSLGSTPLSMAAWSGHDEAVEWLIEKGADVDAPNRDGATPLHAAAFFGHPQTARLLIENGADITAKNARGEQPIDAVKTDLVLTQVVAHMVQVTIDHDRVVSGRKEVSRILREASLIPSAENGGIASVDEAADADVGRRRAQPLRVC